MGLITDWRIYQLNIRKLASKIGRNIVFLIAFVWISQPTFAGQCLDNLGSLIGIYNESNVQAPATAQCDTRAIYDAVGVYVAALKKAPNMSQTFQVNPMNPALTINVKVPSESSGKAFIYFNLQNESVTGWVSRSWNAVQSSIYFFNAQVPKNITWIPPGVTKQMGINSIDPNKGFPTFLLATLISFQMSGITYGTPTQIFLSNVMNEDLQSEVVTLYGIWRTQNPTSEFTMGVLSHFLLTTTAWRYIRSSADFVGTKIDSVTSVSTTTLVAIPLTKIEQNLKQRSFMGWSFTLKLLPKN